MLESGLTLERALRSAATGSKGQISNIFTSLACAVSDGTKMSESMADRSHIFAPLDILLVQVGETTGNLAESIRTLSEWYEFSDRMRRTFISGMLMPLMVFHVAAFLAPFIRLALGGLEDTRSYFIGVITWLCWFYIPAAIIFFIIRFTPRKGFARRVIDWIVLRVPLLGGAIKYLSLSRFFRAFHMFYKSGLPIVQASQMAADVTGNVIITRLVEGGAESAARGGQVSEGFSSRLPSEMLDIWQMGEESGKLEEVTGRLTASTTETAECKFKYFAEWLPRAIYAIICIKIIIAIANGWGQINAAMGLHG